MTSKTCGNNVHILRMTISSTNDVMTFLVEHAHCVLIDWCGQGEQYNTISIAWPGFEGLTDFNRFVAIYICIYCEQLKGKMMTP